MDKRIQLGTVGGTYYNPVVLDQTMYPLADMVLQRMPAVEKVEVSYDQTQDFYHCRFVYKDINFDVRYYKALAYSYNEKPGWIGCPHYKMSEFVGAMKTRAESLSL